MALGDQIIEEPGLADTEVQTPPLWVAEISQALFRLLPETNRHSVERNLSPIVLIRMK